MITSQVFTGRKVIVSQMNVFSGTSHNEDWLQSDVLLFPTLFLCEGEVPDSRRGMFGPKASTMITTPSHLQLHECYFRLRESSSVRPSFTSYSFTLIRPHGRSDQLEVGLSGSSLCLSVRKMISRFLPPQSLCE